MNEDQMDEFIRKKPDIYDEENEAENREVIEPEDWKVKEPDFVDLEDDEDSIEPPEPLKDVEKEEIFETYPENHIPIQGTFEEGSPEREVLDELKAIDDIDKKYDEVIKRMEQINNKIDKLIEKLYDKGLITNTEATKLY